jgi:hypothetical protein
LFFYFPPEHPDKRFPDLVRGGDVAKLTTLLYSPNYFYSLSAMHALNYLKSTGKVGLTPELSASGQNYSVFNVLTGFINPARIA